MIRILLIAGAFLLLALWLRAMYRKHGRRMIWPVIFSLAIIAILALAFTGRIHWLGGLIAALLAGLRALRPVLWRLSPALFYWLRQRFRRRGETISTPGINPGRKMSREEALAVLGLQEGASREDIVLAHRRLVQKLHPDHKGSSRLASVVNQARDVLLS